MRHSNDERAPLFFAQFFHNVASCNHGIDISNAFKVCGRDQSDRTNTEPKQSDANSTDSFYNITFDESFEHSSFHVVIRRHDVELCKLQSRGEGVHSVVKFVIAECANVITDRRHCFILDLTAIEIEV